MHYHSDESNPIQQRRIAERHPITVDLVWHPRQTSRWRRPRPVSASTVDLSLSGVGFESEPLTDVQMGTAVDFTIRGVSSKGVIRHERPCGRGGRRHYGVEFADPKMVLLVGAMIDEQNAGAAEVGTEPEVPFASKSAEEQRFVDWH